MAAILHLGNIEFAKGEEIDSSVIKDDKSRFHLNTTAELLRCSLLFLFCLLFCPSYSTLFLEEFLKAYIAINQCNAEGVMPRAWKMH